MKHIINLYKPVSLTPLQAIEKFKQQNPQYKNQKISYPGRLDPMASGILLLLIEDENKKITKYMKLNKEYRAQILFNFTTDSYDILGIPKSNEKININKPELKKAVKSFQGKYNQTLPPYSSYKIRGKSLFNYARANKLPKKLPQKEVVIKNIKINSIHTITAHRLLKQIKNKINKLEGDFRQKEILDKWNKLLIDKKDKFMVLDVTISCSSGTYIRAIADDFGKKFNTGAILLNLTRTKIGRYDIKDSKRLKR